ncbi:hypothetical protein [Asticcacaulis sp. YBE204]|uniref:hypothetical protein n=1 Tax=Asticcacaulis sp. YBE204 TaxID=1282363 RepID=UPI0003C3D928|nr:hypothetical protein [Asticcacaulis sp. YBE204]ESQ78756.1 hypothetical protein AEYBE204_12285 [Asticcacaulis sp. YBE204]
MADGGTTELKSESRFLLIAVLFVPLFLIFLAHNGLTVHDVFDSLGGAAIVTLAFRLTFPVWSRHPTLSLHIFSYAVVACLWVALEAHDGGFTSSDIWKGLGFGIINLLVGLGYEFIRRRNRRLKTSIVKS